MEMENIVRRQLALIGEDPDRDGLLQTPARVAKSLAWLTRGYEMTAAEVIGDALFEENHESMILVRDIELYSMCEHHMLPFFGKAHIAYVPDGRIVGLSKLPRIVDVFARRAVQERPLTDCGSLMKFFTSRSRRIHRSEPLAGLARFESRIAAITSALRVDFRTPDDSR